MKTYTFTLTRPSIAARLHCATASSLHAEDNLDTTAEDRQFYVFGQTPENHPFRSRYRSSLWFNAETLEINHTKRSAHFRLVEPLVDDFAHPLRRLR